MSNLLEEKVVVLRMKKWSGTRYLYPSVNISRP